MEKVKVKVKGHHDLVLPKYMTNGSAGFDLIATGLRKVYKGSKELDPELFLNAIHEGHFILRAQERALVGTGLFIELPRGKQLEIRPRSGMALKRGLTVINSPGTIDSDYRGEVCVIIYNTTNFLARINFGDAIAQGVVTDYDQIEWEIVKELSSTERGDGGFGHTSFWKPVHTKQINILSEDTALKTVEVGSYYVTGAFALVFPLEYTFAGTRPYDGRKINRITIYGDKTISNEYVKSM